MPRDAPRVKADATRGYGAEIVLFDREREEREAVAARVASERGLHLVHPFDDRVVAREELLALLAESPERRRPDGQHEPDRPPTDQPRTDQSRTDQHHADQQQTEDPR